MSFTLILYIAVPVGVVLLIGISVVIGLCIHGAPACCPCSRNHKSGGGHDVEKGLAKKRPAGRKPAGKNAVVAKKSKPSQPTKNGNDEKAKKLKDDKAAAKKAKEEKARKEKEEKEKAKKAKEEKARKEKEEKAKKEKEEKAKKKSQDEKAKKGKDGKKEKNEKGKEDNKKGTGKVSPSKPALKPADKKKTGAKTKVMAVVAFGGSTRFSGPTSSGAAKTGMKTSGMGMANVA